MLKQNHLTLKKPFYKNWSFWFVVIYLLIILIYTCLFISSDGDNVLLSSNELGDFLAGSFAPLAFLFLYLGYRQQGEALKEQSTELANSVAEQKNLIRIHEEEQREKHFQALPNFQILKEKSERYSQPYLVDDDEGNTVDDGEEEILDVSFELKNFGEVAKNVLIKSIKNYPSYRKEAYQLPHEASIKILLSFDEQTIDQLEKGAEILNTLELTYTNIYGKAYTKIIDYSLCFQQCPEACETFTDFRVEIKSNDQN